MTRLLLVRHAQHDWVGRGFAGRLPGVALNAAGCGQALALADALQRRPLAAIHASPQRRARETAEPLAARRATPVRIADEFDEIDFGAWTGRTFDEVGARDAAAWRHWVERRGSASPPGGEPFAAVQRRAMAGLDRLHREHPRDDDAVVVVSHADVIKATLAGVLGLSLDLLESFDVAPASVSVVEVGDGWQRVLSINGDATG